MESLWSIQVDTFWLLKMCYMYKFLFCNCNKSVINYQSINQLMLKELIWYSIVVMWGKKRNSKLEERNQTNFLPKYGFRRGVCWLLLFLHQPHLFISSSFFILAQKKNIELSYAPLLQRISRWIYFEGKSLYYNQTV